MTLGRDFYARDTAIVARELLGKVLEVATPQGVTSSFIVETEAYLGVGDEASHAYARVTPRNRVMYGDPGHAYVYFSYGAHWCMNAVAHCGTAGAVLLRALQPWKGLRLMMARRGVEGPWDDVLDPERACQRLPAALRNLTSGPGKLTQAAGVGPQHNTLTLLEPPLRILDTAVRLPFDVAVGPRIGISRAVDWPLRFYLSGNPFASRRAPA